MLLASHQQCSCSVLVSYNAKACLPSSNATAQQICPRIQQLGIRSLYGIRPKTLHTDPIRGSRQLRCKRQRVRAMVGDEELVEGIEKGTKVRVKTPVTVFHSPKLGDFNLEGKEGEVLEVVSLYKGKQTSANLPYKVVFMIPQEEKDVKLVAHLSAPEIEAVK